MKFFYFVICIFLMGCPLEKPDPPIDSTLKINNLSERNLMFYESRLMFPDTSLNITSPFPNKEGSEYKNAIILKRSTKEYHDSYRDYFARFPNKLSFFIFSKDTIDQVPWEKIRSEYKILKRYDLGLRELDSLNWTIEYN